MTVIDSPISRIVQSVESPKPKLQLFLSYAHKDEKHVDELRKDLKVMERNGLISPWYDRALIAGEKWEERILHELVAADIIVCQLSRDFLASDFCVLTELKAAIDRKKAGKAELVAYVLKECGWQEIPELKEFQVLPKDAKPITQWGGRKDAYWRAVAEGIKTAVEQVQRNRRMDPGESRVARVGDAFRFSRPH